ncbi:MAG: ABC transporter substrate-binding protein [Candidatus Nanopelagicales bacterium]|jgi:peptide/nickel transport system substrate-binding protein|nr:ABC transporter substrate-binding protein [Candidatus Nanopelagicales bacterium]
MHTRALRRTGAALLAAAAVALTGAPGIAPAEESPSAVPAAAATGPYTVGMTTDVDSLNPFTGIVAESFEMYQLMYPTLTTSSAEDFSPVPDLAESWTESADQTTWTYRIRPDLTWSDGTPLTARDAAYSFNRVIDGDYEQTNYGGYVANITRAEAPDDTTLVLTVSKPTPLMDRLAVYILPEHVWREIDGKEVRSFPNEPTDGQPIVGAGPYLLVERQKGQFLRFQANPTHWRGKPAFDELVFRVYENDDALGQALRKGEVDFAHDMQANVFDAISGDSVITPIEAANYDFSEIGFNTGAALADGTPIGDGHPALRDTRVRQALNWAIDRQVLVDKVLAGHGTPGSTVIPPLYTTLHLKPANPYTYDPARAGQLLDEAGYPLGADGKRQDTDGTPLTLRLLGRQESQESQQTVQFVQGWLEDLGITVETKIVSEDTLIELNGQGNFDIFEWGWGVEPDPDYQLSTFTCAQRSSEDDGTIYAGLSDSHFCNEEYDRLYAEQATQTDPVQRAETVRQMQQILYDEAPYAVTYYPDMLQARRTDAAHALVAQPTTSADGRPGRQLFQFGTWTYDAIQPGAAPADGASDAAGTQDTSAGGVSPAVIGGAAALAVLGIAAAVLLGRRRRSDEDVE